MKEADASLLELVGRSAFLSSRRRDQLLRQQHLLNPLPLSREIVAAGVLAVPTVERFVRCIWTGCRLPLTVCLNAPDDLHPTSTKAHNEKIYQLHNDGVAWNGCSIDRRVH